MDIAGLYKVEKKDMEKLSGLLAECFEQYPLYTQLIPQREKRKEILPELFDLDLEQYFEESEIYADSEALNGIIIVSDRRRSENPIKNFYLECRYVLETGYSLVVKDRSLKTLMNFIRAREYLSSAWQEDIEQDKRLHIEYFAVRSGMQGKGIASKLMKSVLHYADENRLMASLETHSTKNVHIYQHYGFRVFETMQKHLSLKQYCMVR